MTTEVMKDAANRMDRARAILTDNNPRPDCNWGMLDTTALRQAISDASLDTSQSHACTWPTCKSEAVEQEPVLMVYDCDICGWLIKDGLEYFRAKEDDRMKLYTSPHTQAKEIEGLRAAARQALAVLKGCLEHSDADDAIAALNNAAIAQQKETT